MLEAPRQDPSSAAARDAAHVDCAVLTVTYNSADDVGLMLDSLHAAADGLSLRTIVVDNGSTDGTVALVRARKDVRCVVSETNLGYAGGINRARAEAGPCDALLIANPDVVLAPGAIAALCAAVREPGVGVAVPMILACDGTLEHSLRREPSLTQALGDALLGARLRRRPGWLSEVVWNPSAYAGRHAVEWATGAAAMVSAGCDAAVGPWDERYFLYSEEVDYAARVRRAGFRIEYTPTARVRHRAGGSGGSPELVALMAVNRVRYVARRGDGAALFRIVVTLGEILRARDEGHRLAARTLLRRSTWRSRAPGELLAAASVAGAGGGAAP
jgi:GT2 family glycosyltransferase